MAGGGRDRHAQGLRRAGHTGAATTRQRPTVRDLFSAPNVLTVAGSCGRKPRMDGVVALTPAQLAMLAEGIDWRMPERTWRPELAE